MFSFPFILTLYAGFTHAFEADHLLAVSNIVSKRDNVKLSLKDGISWGLGHAVTIFFIGMLMIMFKVSISQQYFHYFEATVGLMLIVLAVYRLLKFYRSEKIVLQTHVHTNFANKYQYTHAVAFGVGLVHGLAGSGALIIVVMSQVKGHIDGLTYLLLFGISCIAGMMLAASLFSIPFSKKMIQARSLQSLLIVISCGLCLVYGCKAIYENIMLSHFISFLS